MPIIASRFRPHPLLKNRHLQTLWNQAVPPRPALDLDLERLELPDGDFLDLCWSGRKEGPIVLLKYLGESGVETTLRAAATVSVPFTLANAAETLQEGFARHYQSYLLRGLIESTRRKFQRLVPPFPLPDLDAIKTIYSFDDRITAPLHGFEGADDYYARSSSRQFLAGIRVPTLILHPRDDPFMTPAGIPDSRELAESVELELTEHGGHMGFVSAGPALLPRFWLAERVPDYLRPGWTRRAPAESLPSLPLDLSMIQCHSGLVDQRNRARCNRNPPARRRDPRPLPPVGRSGGRLARRVHKGADPGLRQHLVDGAAGHHVPTQKQPDCRIRTGPGPVLTHLRSFLHTRGAHRMSGKGADQTQPRGPHQEAAPSAASQAFVSHRL